MNVIPALLFLYNESISKQSHRQVPYPVIFTKASSALFEDFNVRKRDSRLRNALKCIQMRVLNREKKRDFGRKIIVAS